MLRSVSKLLIPALITPGLLGIAWTRNTIPEYVWFNGSAVNTLPEDEIDDSRPVPINRLQGAHDDPAAMAAAGRTGTMEDHP